MATKDESSTMDGQGIQSDGGILLQLLQARNRNKTQRGGVPQLPLLSEQTPVQAAATALGRTAETLYQMPVQAESVTLNGVSLAEIPEMLPDGALLMILQGQGDEMGVMALCREAVAALIEMQTCGRVTSRPVPKRKLTRGDALMCAEFANSLLGELAADLGGVEGYSEWGGFRYATFLDDPRPLELILEDRLFRSMTCHLGLGQNQIRQARIFVALPSSPAGADKPRESETVSIPTTRSAPRTTETKNENHRLPNLAASIQDVPVDVFAILCRRKITLGELRSLKEGATISLPRVSLSDTTLELSSGHVLAGGKLGEADGYQAIRLHDPERLVMESQDHTDPVPVSRAVPDLDAVEVGSALPVDLDAPNEFLMEPSEIAPLDLEAISTADSA